MRTPPWDGVPTVLFVLFLTETKLSSQLHSTTESVQHRALASCLRSGGANPCAKNPLVPIDKAEPSVGSMPEWPQQYIVLMTEAARDAQPSILLFFKEHK